MSLLDFVSIRVKTLYYSAKLVFQVIHPKSTHFSLFWNMVLEADLCLHCDTEAVTPREKNDCRIRKIEDWRTILVASHNLPLCWYTIWGGKRHLISLTCPLSDYQSSKRWPDWLMAAALIWGTLILPWYSQGQTELPWSWRWFGTYFDSRQGDMFKVLKPAADG